MMGCCADNACTPETCMNLPDGKTCEDCVHVKRCTSIYGVKPTDTACGWFPRKLKQREQRGLNADDLERFFAHFKVSERDRQIYTDFYHSNPRPMKTELARNHGISPSRIHQILNRFRRRISWWKGSSWRRLNAERTEREKTE